MAATKRKKLYFDISLVTLPSVVRACTQFRATYPGDLYGSVLEDFAALTAGSSANDKQRNEVTAWFVPVDGEILDGGRATQIIDKRNQRVYVRFVQATVSDNTDGTGIAAGLTFPGRIQGTTPIGTRHFSVLVARDSKLGGTNRTDISPTVRGRLYVQRQHKIEI